MQRLTPVKSAMDKLSSALCHRWDIYLATVPKVEEALKKRVGNNEIADKEEE